MHLIERVEEHSPAARHGIKPGMKLKSINGEEIIDIIDYEALTHRSRLEIILEDENGTERKVSLLKAKEIPLGLSFGDSMDLKPRTCRNKCVFCFIDQLPDGMRDTLYVKDDDWRMSLMMGNYVTLTNVDDEEFDRMIKRKVSPLYISVHTTDPALRCRMMNNRFADKINDRLKRLCEAKIRFHCQIVLCPGLNDGEALVKTLEDLSGMYPCAQSAALVPVGLTRYREGLAPLRPFTAQESKAVMEICEDTQRRCLEKYGTRFVYPSDEMLLLAGKTVPGSEAYEGFGQIENGVGLLRMFEDSLSAASAENTRAAKPRRVLVACGVSVAPVMRQWVGKYAPDGVKVSVQPIVNHFFGETVTVTGLLTGGDLAEQLKNADTDEILLCANTLRNEGDLFLDGMSLETLRSVLPAPLTVVQNTGNAFFEAMLGMGD